MNPADLPLRDIHLPPAPGWWPPAPGWWLLLAFALLAAIALGWYLRRRTRTRTRRAALAELRSIVRRYARTQDSHALAAELSVLLRRLVLAKRPREETAGLAGGAWLDLLDTLSPRAPLDPVVRRTLLEAPYRRGAPCDAGALIAACERWLRALPA